MTFVAIEVLVELESTDPGSWTVVVKAEDGDISVKAEEGARVDSVRVGHPSSRQAPR